MKEVSPIKQNLLLVNKSDFLSEEQRKAWAEYFKSENIKFAFFSAITEDADSIIDELNSVSDNEEAEVNNDSENEVEDDDSVKSSESEIDSSIQVLSSTQLLALFRYLNFNFILCMSEGIHFESIISTLLSKHFVTTLFHS